MEQSQLDAVQGWFAGRLPEGWFTGTEVTIEDDQIVVMGTLPEMDVIPGATPEFAESAAAGRITRFRELTRGERVTMAREAEYRFGRFVTWGARLGGVTKRFTPGGSGWHGGRRGHGWGRRGPGWRQSGWAGASGPDVQTF